MAGSQVAVRRMRNSFGRIPEVTQLPNLIEVQKDSYEQFLQKGVAPEKREKIGIQEVFQSVFPVKDFSDKAQLEFVAYDFEEPKYDVEECQRRSLTYSAPLRVTLRLVVWDLEEGTGVRSIKDIKEQEVYLGDVPLMTKHGTFVVNGSERVVVSQMHRSPGVFFDHDEGKTHSSGMYLFSARVIPYRGSWLDFEFDPKDIVYVRIDRRRKLPVTTLLMALDNEETAKKRAKLDKEGEELASADASGMSKEDILNFFYESIEYVHTDKGWKVPFDAKAWKNVKLPHDLINADTKKVVAEAGTKLTPRALKKLEEAKLKTLLVPEENAYGRFLGNDVLDTKTGEVLASAGDELTKTVLTKITKAGIQKLNILAVDNINVSSCIRDTLELDKNSNREEALLDIYRVLRPGEPPTIESAEALFKSLFFDIERYDLSSVGRVKMNARLDLKTEDTVRVLRKEDILAIVKELVALKEGRGEVDDIDHLGNRRVRSVGELVENQYRVGLLRMERSIRERMGAVEIDTVMPHDLVNAKPIAAAMREFFGSSQLSQFMDQQNPLAEITHKRRLSALGPGGLTRERAGFEVRDVHTTHYGRICPIETPEGPNIGLINSLATYARVNQYGFIESPYRKVVNGKVTNEVIYLSAMEEGKHTIAQANAVLNKDGTFVDKMLSCRHGNDFVMVTPKEIDLIDVSPKQLISAAASLIPFLENDDANRALMGSNMQRQAVPLLNAEAPLVGTGMEGVVARDSGVVCIAKRDGVVDQVDASRIVVRAKDASVSDDTGVDVYNLLKFQRSNQSTCINQRPIVKAGDHVKAGEVIADGPSTDSGELALGRNVLVGFMSWGGYNFEDSIILSERIVKEDVFTSIHIEEYEIMARDTKLGNEEITRDIPNVGEEALRHLDEAGIVHIGATVKAGDILVGKVTPKGESPMTPEEKLLRAIFGEKASDVRDTSLRLDAGAFGTVVDVRVFSRRGIDKDERALSIEASEIERLAQARDVERRILEDAFYDRLKDRLVKQKVVTAPKLKAGTKIDDAALESLTKGQWRQIVVDNEKVMAEIEEMKKQIDKSVEEIQAKFDDKVEKVRSGDELSPGVMKMVKVFVAVKRKMQPGDKMAGRHGNKGVVSCIVPAEDMPYLEDGTPLDIILNPLGVPSRMNVGQILETHLGWASEGFGKQINKMLTEVQKKSQKHDALKKMIKEFYIDPKQKKNVDEFSDEQLEEFAALLKKGVPVATPVFDGAHEQDIVDGLKKAGLSETGQVMLTDGKTGELFDRPVTVGQIYMLKLGHMVDDKIHARSIGPYSLVTQQPLGGKAQMGGQRFGEMEVWALEAYGAAYTLQEMLTVKSDDVSGRTKVYEAIVRGDNSFETGVPESFNVLVKELKSLGLDVELNQSEK